MFCPKCGNILPDTAKFCGSCGAYVERLDDDASYTKVNEDCDHPHNPWQDYEMDEAEKAIPTPVGLSEAVKLFFVRFADYRGRSSRAEFWWAVLFLMFLSSLISGLHESANFLLNAVMFFPTMALSVRRLHDIGKSGFYYLWSLVPVVGNIYLLVLFLCPSAGNNQWGPGPQH